VVLPGTERQRRTAVMERVPKRFVDEPLCGRSFQRASSERRRRLDEVASKLIEQALDAKAADAEGVRKYRTAPNTLVKLRAMGGATR
jgi:hypothetical protein